MQDYNKTIENFKVSFEYEVYFLSGCFREDNTVLKNLLIPGNSNIPEQKILFVIEETLMEFFPSLCEDTKRYIKSCGDGIRMTDDPRIISGGESFKTFQTIEYLCRIFAENNLCRHSYVGIIGGGAFLDAVGLAASLVHRGIRQIRFPSTVLSQNDSGVGVKNGVNMFGKKNFAGTFAPPYAVINDFDFLESLDYRDWISGVPEAFKVAMIKDAVFFGWLCENSAKFAKRDPDTMQQLIEKCAKLHLNHIASSGDPFEFGSARPLDFGHWSAHKLEMITDGNIRHGEAVAIGLLLDTFYAVKIGLLNQEILDEVIEVFSDMGLPLSNQAMTRKDPNGNYLILEGIEEFREHLGGELHITLPDGLGKKKEISSMDENIIKEGIEFLLNL